MDVSLYFFLAGDILYYKGTDGSPLGRVLPSEEEKVAILTEVHAGHIGRNCVVGKIRQRFYWHNIREDVE